MKVTQVLVDGTPMRVQDSGDGNAKVGNDAPHSHYAVQRSDVHAELTAIKAIATKIGHVDSVVETFGGSGWHSSIIQKACWPQFHQAWDIAADCVESIKMSLPHVEARQVDSYDTEIPSASWVHCDFNNLTWARYKRSQTAKTLLTRAVNAARIWLTVTDSALFGLRRFEQNRRSYDGDTYGKAAITRDDFLPYYAIWSRHLLAHGFKLIEVRTWSAMAGMMLFKRTSTGIEAAQTWSIIPTVPNVKVQVQTTVVS